ncbi:unnamed protein product [Caretta caretta]
MRQLSTSGLVPRGAEGAPTTPATLGRGCSAFLTIRLLLATGLSLGARPRHLSLPFPLLPVAYGGGKQGPPPRYTCCARAAFRAKDQPSAACFRAIGACSSAALRSGQPAGELVGSGELGSGAIGSARLGAAEGRRAQASKMNVGVAHSEVNPNTRVMNSRGMWLTYALGVGMLHIVLLSIPFFSVPVAWTLTNVIHNLGMYVFLHAVKGTPFETPDQGKARLLTHWEQLDYGVQFTSSRKFFTISPIILYFLASFYTKYDPAHFILNTASLLSVLIPKLPQLHGVRIFGINKY